MPRRSCVALLTELADISPYFAVGTGPVDDGWRPVRQLYTDPAPLDGIIARVGARMDVVERRVAASTFFLGFAARLWSIGLGALAGHRLLPDLDVERLLFRESDGQVQLHIEDPVAWQGDDLEPMLVEMVLEWHLGPLGAALRRLGPISDKLLRGNAASALLGAARVFDGNAAAGPGWQLARRLCSDERLSAAIRFNGVSYRRTSCCLYYRAPRGGLCSDCSMAEEDYR
jgi:iron complex transport system ATP-binding protein